LASDIANIIKSEIVSTLESLLSVSSSVENVKSVSPSDLSDGSCIEVETNFDFSGSSSVWKFYIPTATATKFEYLMLGGIADLKDAIDDEISDAAKEIVSTICGSITTSVNAQGFDDVKDMKFSLGASAVKECSKADGENLYKFDTKLNDETLIIGISFDGTSQSLVMGLTGEVPAAAAAPAVAAGSAPAAAGGLLSTILGEENVENLRLLFDIKMRLSVRLGTKICLLRDVISWDIGEIIELTQMANEPLDILVNGVVVAQGEAVIVDGKFGVKIKNIGEPKIV
jgi:flagellar motor switch protein FliN/FliY